MPSNTTRSERDPTNQGINRNKANRDNNSRLNIATKSVLALWREINAKKTSRKQVVNENLDFYVYELTEEELNLLAFSITEIIESELETETEETPNDYYFEEYVETAARSGVIQENAWLESILQVLGVGLVSAELIRQSQTYNAFLTKRIDETYKLFKNLSEKSSNDVYQTILRGMEAGLGKRAISREIVKRFEVSKSSSKRIVDTEINWIYNDSRMEVVSFYRGIGANIGVQHLSALLPTTRNNHAARHGRAYTPEQQLRWWNTGTNRIHCHCSVRSIALNKDGTVKDKSAQQKVIERGKAFFKG